MAKQLEFRRSDLRNLTAYESKLLAALADLYAGKWDNNPALKAKIKAVLFKQWAAKVGTVPFNGFKSLITTRQKRNTSVWVKIGNRSVKFNWLIVDYDKGALEDYVLKGNKPVKQAQCNVAPGQPSLPIPTAAAKTKQEFKFELTAIATDGKPRTRKTLKLRYYRSSRKSVYITDITDEKAVVQIRKGRTNEFKPFEIKKHKTQNYYQGLVNGSKVRVVLMITKAKFTYWAENKADLIK